MRLTTSLIMRNYTTNLNSSLSELNKLNGQVTSGRSFSKASDDPAAALKAYKVRRNLSDISIYKDNIGDAGDQLSQVESAISALNQLATEASVKILQGQNGTLSEVDRTIIGNALRDMQEQVLSAVNTKFGDKYIFGGSSLKTAPFTVDIATGALLYNGVNVDTGTFGSDPVYVDIGLGLSTDASGDVIAQTAFDIAYPGNELIGSGVDGDGITNNFYNLLGEIADMFENNDLTNLDAHISKLSKKQEEIRIAYASVGEKVNFIEFLSSRFDTEETNALTKQTNLEKVDPVEAILAYKSQEVAYNAALQMGTKILQNSLIDYLR